RAAGPGSSAPRGGHPRPRGPDPRAGGTRPDRAGAGATRRQREPGRRCGGARPERTLPAPPAGTRGGGALLRSPSGSAAERRGRAEAGRGDPPAWRDRISHDRHAWLLALAGGAPAVAVALALIWQRFGGGALA